MLGELENRAEKRVRHVKVAAAIFRHAIGEFEAVGDGRNLMGVRVDLEYSAMWLDIVGLVEDVKRVLLPQFAQQIDRRGTGPGRNGNDVYKVAVLVDDADIAEPRCAVGIRCGIQ